MNISPKDFETKIRNKEHLPSGLVVTDGVRLYNCTSLTELPENLIVHGNLNLSLCTSLTELPDNLEVNGHLSLWYCTSLKSLPYKIRVGDTIYCDKELIDTIPKENLPLYINFNFKESVHEHFIHRIRN